MYLDNVVYLLFIGLDISVIDQDEMYSALNEIKVLFYQ